MGKPGPKSRPPIERFLSLTRPSPSGCLEWIGCRSTDGYGYFAAQGRRVASAVRAHRWSYEYHVGPIPEGLQIDHLCRNRACVNPDHLEPVTPRENCMRATTSIAAVNSRKTHCIHGHPLSGDNLYVPPAGWRQCRQCHRDRAAARKKKAS